MAIPYIDDDAPGKPLAALINESNEVEIATEPTKVIRAKQQDFDVS